VQLELAHDRGGEVNPSAAHPGERERLTAGLAQPLGQPLLMSASVIERILAFRPARRRGSACSSWPLVGELSDPPRAEDLLWRWASWRRIHGA
jgi:hypothetical protein